MGLAHHLERLNNQYLLLWFSCFPHHQAHVFLAIYQKGIKVKKKYMSCKRTTSMSFLRLKLKNIKHKTTWGHRHLHRTSRWRTCWRPWRSTSDADRKGFPLTAEHLQFTLWKAFPDFKTLPHLVPKFWAATSQDLIKWKLVTGQTHQFYQLYL